MVGLEDVQELSGEKCWEGPSRREPTACERCGPAWWLLSGVGQPGPLPAVLHFQGEILWFPYLGLPQNLPGELRKCRFLDFRPVRGNCTAHRRGPHPHPTARKQEALGHSWRNTAGLRR